MKKFLVLNQQFQTMSPIAMGHKQNANAPAAYKVEDNLMEEKEAREFLEHMASTMIGQTFHLAEIQGSAKAAPPVKWF